jgi:hypothetical protein
MENKRDRYTAGCSSVQSQSGPRDVSQDVIDVCQDTLEPCHKSELAFEGVSQGLMMQRTQEWNVKWDTQLDYNSLSTILEMEAFQS